MDADTSPFAPLKKFSGPRGYLHKPEDLALYEYDGGIDKARPDLVVFPRPPRMWSRS